MTVAVLGPGAVGGVLTVGFIEAGMDVICVARPDTAKVLKSEGLSLRQGERVRTVRPQVTTELREPVDLLLVTVKAPSLGDALARVGAPAGVVVVNGGTHGSEPHMGFGGVKQSGTGWREAGVEALDVYTEWKYVNLIADPALT